MAGQFDQSIAHYRAALAIDSKFYSSEFGIADTYSLMGDQVQARKQYEAAFREFPALPELHRIQWKTREAITYVREADYENADRAFHAIAAYAHSKHMSQVEADSYRQMALYQPDAKHALALLKKARRTLAHRRNAAPLLVKQESAQILRARVEAALKTGDKKLVNRSLAQLAKLSQSSDDKLIDVEYHGAAGAVAFAQNKNDDAISHLEEDTDNPSSLQLLAAAYHRVGNRADAQTTSETLANLNEPTVEQALIVPAFRACYKDPACSGDTRTGEQKQSRRSRPMLM
jgi:tetratricopeptide (TPR) repeat protein